MSMEIVLVSRLRTFILDFWVPTAIMSEMERAKNILSKHETTMNNILDVSGRLILILILTLIL